MKHIFTIVLMIVALTANAQSDILGTQQQLHWHSLSESYHTILSAGEIVEIRGSSIINVVTEETIATINYPNVEIILGAALFFRYLFDLDDNIEYVLSNSPGLMVYNINGTAENYYGGNGEAIVQGIKNAYIVEGLGGAQKYSETLATELPGNLPEHDHMLAQIRASVQDNTTTPRVDTVYVSETITQIDTVREIVTERIFTSDTVYINETITIDDNGRIERRG